MAALTVAVLVLTAESQIYDTNFYSTWEATALLAGDHPYRDFFEWGIPLQAVVSAGAQLLVGYRLIGEFLVQWVFITAGAVISFQLALRVSRSTAASLVTALLVLPILAATPTFHYPKLFFYPFAIWIAWRYIDRPTATGAIVFGVTTAAAFLFRHDHGVYIGALAALTFALARLVIPPLRNVRAALVETAAYGLTVLALIAPWAIVVQMNEGLPEYVRSRAQLYREWSATQSPYRTLWSMNPVRFLLGPPLPPPTRATVSFEWESSVDDGQRVALERQYGLRVIEPPKADGGHRWVYEVANVYDPALWDLNGAINNADGFDWNVLQRARSRLPTYEDAQSWLEQAALLMPLLLLAAMAADALLARYRGEPIPLEVYTIALAATFLAAIDRRLFREASYVVVIAPVTAALSARFLVAPARGDRADPPARNAWLTRAWGITRRALALGMLFVTGVASYAFSRQTHIYEPLTLLHSSRIAFSELLVSPPIDGYMSPEELRHYDRTVWVSGDNGDRGRLLVRYVHDCTRTGDRVLVTGSTPYHIGYYLERPIAGGHLFWHHRWRSDPEHERRSLELLEHQSVPFALSTHDPILDDFKTYPSIRAYLLQHYVELEGSHGLLLIDKRRQATGTFGAVGFPCFR